ncbi:MAG: hypothetical protein GY756_14390 [bacterium]|nr:hypothetical protein [bacterium]
MTCGYVTKIGDTLPSIALEIYGNPQAWVIIYEANKFSIGTNFKAVYSGQRLLLPEYPGKAVGFACKAYDDQRLEKKHVPKRPFYNSLSVDLFDETEEIKRLSEVRKQYLDLLPSLIDPEERKIFSDVIFDLHKKIEKLRTEYYSPASNPIKIIMIAAKKGLIIIWSAVLITVSSIWNGILFVFPVIEKKVEPESQPVQRLNNEDPQPPEGTINF